MESDIVITALLILPVQSLEEWRSVGSSHRGHFLLTQPNNSMNNGGSRLTSFRCCTARQRQEETPLRVHSTPTDYWRATRNSHPTIWKDIATPFEIRITTNKYSQLCSKILKTFQTLNPTENWEQEKYTRIINKRSFI